MDRRRIPFVDPAKIIGALERFDAELRHTDRWKDWIQNTQHKHAVRYSGKVYPVKQTISMATGLSHKQFSGGPESNTYLRKLGFEIISLDDYRRKGQERSRKIAAAHEKAKEYTSDMHQEQRRAFAESLSRVLNSEQVALLHLADYVEARGFHFDFEHLLRFHISVKAKPFVILSGLSGTGKSKLPVLYADAFGGAARVFPVSPAWMSDADLLGYYNPVHQHFIATDFLEFLMEAEKNPNKLYIAIIDEMNLARVEHYFSSFLSILEREPGEQIVKLYNPAVPVKNTVPSEIRIGPNLVFVGTVNIDESVKPFSDKVLDRANIVSFDTVKIGKRPLRGQTDNLRVPMALFNLWKQPLATHEQEVLSILSDLNEVLLQQYERFGRNMQFGHRVAYDVCSWVDQAAAFLPWRESLDIQVFQRILPKVRGRSEEMKDLLKDLRRFCESRLLKRCGAGVDKLEKQLGSGYVQLR